MNLGWIADERVQDLFRRSTPTAGTTTASTRSDSSPRCRRSASTPGGRRRLRRLGPARCATTCAGRSTRPGGSSAAGDRRLGLVAYFSPEFGIAEALPQYSGGLGILAGDHLKAANDLGVPLVGRRALLPPRLLPAVARPQRLAARTAPASEPARAWRSTPVPDVRVVVDLAGRAGPRSGLAGRRSAASTSTCSTPTSRSNADERPRHHRPSLRRRHRAAHPPGDRARHRRRARCSTRSACSRRCST